MILRVLAIQKQGTQDVYKVIARMAQGHPSS